MISEEIKNLLQTMEYEKQNTLPTMKSLRQHFRKLAVERHPDKGGTDKEFQELYKAYEILGNIIASQNAEDVDTEEMEARRMFKEENWEEIKSASITIRVNCADGGEWESVLKENFGEPKKNSAKESENKGERYCTVFSHEGEQCRMTITMWKPAKKFPDKRTILVQAERTKQSFNVPFVNLIFPKLYKEVKSKRKQETKSGHNLRQKKKVSYSDDTKSDEHTEEETEHSEMIAIRNKIKSKKSKREIMSRKCVMCQYTTTTLAGIKAHIKLKHYDSPRTKKEIYSQHIKNNSNSVSKSGTEDSDPPELFGEVSKTTSECHDKFSLVETGNVQSETGSISIEEIAAALSDSILEKVEEMSSKIHQENTSDTNNEKSDGTSGESHNTNPVKDAACVEESSATTSYLTSENTSNATEKVGDNTSEICPEKNLEPIQEINRQSCNNKANESQNKKQRTEFEGPGEKSKDQTKSNSHKEQSNANHKIGTEIQCQICELQVSDKAHLMKHIRGSHGIHEIRNNYNENGKNCKGCVDLKEKINIYDIEILKEKERRILTESDRDVKLRNLKLKTTENERLKSQHEKQNQNLKELQKQMEKIRKELKIKEDLIKSNARQMKQQQNENKKIINELSDENNRISNEKELFKKLFEEERQSKAKNVDKIKSPEDRDEEYIDFDNLTYDDSSEDEQTWTSTKASDRGRRHKCSQCSYTSINKTHVTEHEETHKQKHKCDVCEYKTSNRNDLIHHKESHAKNSHKCTQCDYVAKDKRSLEMHTLIAINHINKKSHEKQMSQKTNEGKSTDEVHNSNATATKESKIQCNLCDFSAKNEDILKKHMKVAMGHKLNIICKFYQRKGCRKGKFCRFQHPQESSSSNRQVNKKVDGQSSVQCKYWEECTRFPSCGFTHYEICKYQEKCHKKEFCHFVHLTPTFLGASQWRNPIF